MAVPADAGPHQSASGAGTHSVMANSCQDGWSPSPINSTTPPFPGRDTHSTSRCEVPPLTGHVGYAARVAWG